MKNKIKRIGMNYTIAEYQLQTKTPEY